MTVVRRGLTLVASAALSLALAGSATASLASNDLPAWACSPAESGVAAAGAGAGAEARGGSTQSAAVGNLVRDRDSGQTARDLPQAAQGRAPSNFSVTVPVTVASAVAKVGRLPASRSRSPALPARTTPSGTGRSRPAPSTT